MPQQNPSHLAEPSGADSVDGGAEHVAETLTAAYGLAHAEVRRLPIGQGARNYTATTAERVVFVKQYPSDTDLAGELAGIGLSRVAGEAGVPVAEAIPSNRGELIVTHRGTAISVWAYVEGRPIETGWNAVQVDQAGRALGRIHRRFRAVPESSRPADGSNEWLEFDLADMEATIDRLLAIISARESHDEFDKQAELTLRERQAVVGRIPGMLTALPPLTSQVVHGDYSAVNLMFTDDTLAAVIDFRPPDPFLIAWELGRIAFDPRGVVLTAGWLESGLRLVRAYLEEDPGAAEADIVFCAHVALLQLMRSLYGVKNHYLKPGLLQDDLDEFWLFRHRASQALLALLDEIEDALRSVWAEMRQR
jgi:homoserine kinase type II